MALSWTVFPKNFFLLKFFTTLVTRMKHNTQTGKSDLQGAQLRTGI